MIQYYYATTYIDKKLYLFARLQESSQNLVQHLNELARQLKANCLVLLDDAFDVQMVSSRIDPVLDQLIRDNVFSYLPWKEKVLELS